MGGGNLGSEVFIERDLKKLFAEGLLQVRMPEGLPQKVEEIVLGEVERQKLAQGQIGVPEQDYQQADE